MAKLGIYTGSVPNDGTGDSLIDGAIKINSNFDEIYSTIGDGSTLAVPVTDIVAGAGITLSGSTGSVTITNTGIANTSNVTTENLFVAGIATVNNFLRLPSGTLSNNQIQLGNGQEFTLQYNSAGTVGILTVLNNPLSISGSTLSLSSGTTKIEIDDSVDLYYGSSLKRLETTGAGVTVFGTTQTQQLNVSGVSAFTGVSTFSGATTFSDLSVAGIVTARTGAAVTYYGDASYITAGKWVLGANGSTDYTFTGIGFTVTTNDPVIYLARGNVYEFVNNSGGSHPFQIRVSNGGAAYNNGVTNNGAASGTIRFEIPMDAPNTLYYQCTSDAGMGNTISVYPNTI